MLRKKLLSLGLATAMVATTAMPAFATTQVEVQQGSEKEVEVKIEGNVAAHDGTVLPSTVTVTVPTSANFTVKSDGSLISGSMNITSNGDSAVSVIASKFIDTTGENGINIVKTKDDINSREKINLKITGGDKEIILSSEKNADGTSGKMYESDGSSEITADENFVIGNVTKDKPLNLRLDGEGQATVASDAAIQDNFKLVLKIKKER